MKFYELALPYFKKGDDMSHCLESASTLQDALEMHASMMDDAAKIIRCFALAIKDVDGIEINADTHMIQVSGPKDILDKLAGDEILYAEDFDDEDECSS